MQNVLTILRIPLAGAAIVTVALIALGIREPVPLLAVAVCVIAFVAIGHEWLRGSRVRHRRGESYPLALARLLGANRPRYGGYIVHLGIAMLAIGAIGSSFYAVQRDYNMALGESDSLGDYRFTYVNFHSTPFSDRIEMTARFDVAKQGRDIGSLDARRTFYISHEVAATRAAIRSTPIEDFYIVPSEFTESGAAVFRVYVNPLVWWMWVAGPLFVLGSVLALSPRRRSVPATLPLPRGVRMAGV